MMMGGAKKKKDKKSSMVRQFLVRKKNSLELMYTNGLTHWTDHVANSEVKPPFSISDVSLSSNNATIIAYYQVYGTD